MTQFNFVSEYRKIAREIEWVKFVYVYWACIYVWVDKLSSHIDGPLLQTDYKKYFFLFALHFDIVKLTINACAI